METVRASKSSWKHIICCIVLLVIFVLTIGMHIDAEGKKGETAEVSEASDIVPLHTMQSRLVAHRNYLVKNEVKLAGPKEEVIMPDNALDYYITIYADEIKFFAETFSVDYDKVIEDLNKRFTENKHLGFEKTNIGFILDDEGNVKTYTSVEYGIVEYFYDYVEKHPREVNKKRVPYSGDAKYVENLIIYYTTHIYTNVDTSTALSIGAAESGYYKVKYMLQCNNVFGGMSSKGLIKYRNIEYGVLSYIRLLSNSYYEKGRTTIEKIGKVYCPRYDNNGNKIASPHWIKLVKSAKNKYDKKDLTIELEALLSV